MKDDASLDEEEVLFVGHRHWSALIPTLATILFLLGLLCVLWMLPGMGPAFHSILTLLIPLCFLVGWIIATIVWSINYLNMLILTDQRVIYAQQFSLLGHSIREWNIHDVRAVRVVVTTFLQTAFGYGTLELEERGGHDATRIEGMADPEYISAIILRQDDRFKQLKDTARKSHELLKFMSHEIKGHLTKSKAAFAAIAEGDYGPVAAPLGSMVQDALADSSRGVETVMSILDAPDGEKGAMTFTMQTFDLSDAARRTVEEFRPRVESKGISISIKASEHCFIKGDEQKIARHVLRNLLDNAIRYTPKGTITVVVERADNRARLSVSDSGVGIEPSDMQKLFTWGGHGEHSREVNAESTGYGLYIAKKVVDGHGGNITAQSAGPGQGTTFIMELPLAPVEI